MSLALGLNSGSSFDGIDVVVVDIENGTEGYPALPKFIGGNSHAWPDAVAEKVLRAFDNKVTLFEPYRLNSLAGAVYAASARSLMRELSLEPEQLEVIGFDGQTIYQQPPEHARLAGFRSDDNLIARWLDGPLGCGLQIGAPSIIAVACETTTVTQIPPDGPRVRGNGRATSGLRSPVRCRRRSRLAWESRRAPA
jgi:anhydro-N-acetylmuramic acid kinase